MGKRVTACDRVKTCAQKKEPGPRRHAGASLLARSAERRTEERNRETEASRKRVVKGGGGGGGGGGWCLPARCDIKSRKDTGRFCPFFSRQKGKSRRRKMKKIPSNQKRLRWGGKTKQKSVQRTFGPPHKRATVSILAEQESVEQKSAFLFSPLTQMYIFSAKRKSTTREYTYVYIYMFLSSNDFSMIIV